MSEPIRLRTRYTVLPLIGVIAVFEVVPFSAVVVGGGLASTILWIAVLAVMGTVQWRLWRTCFIASAEGLTARYFHRDVHVPWSEVAGLAVQPNGNGGVYVAVRLADGRFLRTQGYATRSRETAVPLLEKLESARATFI